MAAEPTWETLDWAALDRLREAFLAGAPVRAPYWTSSSDLANYDVTFAQRIAWKWDAALDELRRGGWTPPATTALDWGCGSGIAGRRVIAFFGPGHFKTLRVFDRSALAMDFAVEAARKAFPGLNVERADPRWLNGDEPAGVLVVSHVLSELETAGQQRLRRLMTRADALLWVEPGAHADSRTLIAAREQLRQDFHVIAPCTHAGPCGLLTGENERHWCHHFARPPAGIMADSNWVRFARRAGIDLRSLPYSFLVLEKKAIGSRRSTPHLLSVEGCSRVLGAPRVYKGFIRMLSCQDDGVREITLRKRAAPALFKRISKGESASVYRWRLHGDRISSEHGAAYEDVLEPTHRAGGES